MSARPSASTSSADRELTDPELRVMNAVWDAGEIDAKGVVADLLDAYGYSASTTYTLIYRCIKKGLLLRRDPGFMLSSLVSREEVQDRGAVQLADRFFEGSVDKLFAALVDRRLVTDDAIARMRAMIDDYESASCSSDASNRVGKS